jgi:hypothetical protein
VTGADRAAQELRERKVRFVSPGVVTLAAAEQSVVRSLVVRDPDGHAMQLIER